MKSITRSANFRGSSSPNGSLPGSNRNPRDANRKALASEVHLEFIMHLLHEGQPATVMEGHCGITLRPSSRNPLCHLHCIYSTIEQTTTCSVGGLGGMELILENGGSLPPLLSFLKSLMSSNSVLHFQQVIDTCWVHGWMGGWMDGRMGGWVFG